MNKAQTNTKSHTVCHSVVPGRESGFSLVELMIAMVLGIVIVGGCITIFTGVVRSSTLNQTISTMQSKARFAMDMIGRDVRSSGFLGCVSGEDTELNIAMSNAPTDNLAGTAIAGAVVGATNWSPSVPMGFTLPTAAGKPVAGTQALSVQYARYAGGALASDMSGRGASITLADPLNAPVFSGDLMVISDCTRADLFEVDTVTGPATGKTITPTESLAKAYSISPDFPQNTRVMLFASSIYYIGDTQRVTEQGDAVYSLYQQTYPYSTANPPLELLEGVDQMQLEFGIRLSSNSVVYVQPDNAAYNASAVETVRIGLLISSHKRFPNVDAARQYTLAGRSVVPQSPMATDATYPADKRMRMPFNATFSVRNRNL